MRWSKSLIPTLKEIPQEAEAISHKLMLRAGLMRKLASGTYSYLPLGFKVLKKVERIIQEEMDRSGAQEVLLPALQPVELWKESGRYSDLGDDMVTFKDRHGKEVVLGPTHEEVITDLVRKEVKSYRQLPIILYQIQTKFRDEIRPRFGVIRSKEFIMKDAYSFDRDIEGLNSNYEKMYKAYCRIFERCGLSYIIVEADPGIMGGDVSHEFMVLAQNGEDTIVNCPSCGYAASLAKAECPERIAKHDPCPRCGKGLKIEHAIEIGHIFKLGTKYSKSLGARFLDEDGKEKDIIMGCYGIGVSRIVASVIEKSHDEDGIIWPVSISPFEVLILPVNPTHAESTEFAEETYKLLLDEGIDTLLDDRDERPGIKFKDADLIGIPFRVVIGEKNLKLGKVEIKDRKTKEVITIPKEEVISTIKALLKKEEER